MFYKVVQNNTIIDVLNNLTFVRTQIAHNILISCHESFAQGILSSNRSETWFVDGLIVENTNNYPTVELVEIDEEEYNILKDALSVNDFVEIIEEPIEQPEDELTEDELNTVAFVKEAKIKEMKNVCRLKIESGVDTVLSDGSSYHFSLTTQDQLNLATLSDMIRGGETSVPYHADGEPCKFYSVEDILTIISVAREHITYHTTYYNSLRAYISSLRSIKTINAVEYGCEVPEKYQSEVFVGLQTK